jgi:hypothetical protein
VLPKIRVSEILNGKHGISKARAKQLAELLRVTVDLFVSTRFPGRITHNNFNAVDVSIPAAIAEAYRSDVPKAEVHAIHAGRFAFDPASR